MNVLAFDTCFGAVSAAVHWHGPAGERLTREAYEEMTAGQAERLLPMIAEVMRDAGLAFADLHRIAVTRGPGSFTGVRVGVAAARALALATGVPTVSQTSLAVMAEQARLLLGDLSDALAVVIDARRGGLYLQLFDPRSSEPLSSPEAVTPQEAAQRIMDRRVVAVGSGAEILARAAAELGTAGIEPKLTGLQPHAGTLALMAPTLVVDTPVRPLYLRAPDAKPKKGAGMVAATD